MESNFTKASGAANVGLFILGVIGLAFVIWDRLYPQTGQSHAPQGVAAVASSWLMPGLLGLCIVTAAVLYLIAAYISRTKKPEIATDAEEPLEEISDRPFVNETVPLDGRRYLRCTFENITFHFQGGKTAIENCYFRGLPSVFTDNLVVFGTMALLKGLRIVHPDFPLYGPDRKPVDSVQPLTPVSITTQKAEARNAPDEKSNKQE